MNGRRRISSLIVFLLFLSFNTADLRPASAVEPCFSGYSDQQWSLIARNQVQTPYIRLAYNVFGISEPPAVAQEIKNLGRDLQITQGYEYKLGVPGAT